MRTNPDKHKIRYAFTWISLGIFLLSGIFLVAAAWNRQLSPASSLVPFILCWVLNMAAGVFLFLLAVKKAHRQMIDDQRLLREEEKLKERKARTQKARSKEKHVLDPAASARKIIRHLPEKTAYADLGPEIMKMLAKELEIMSGLYYLKKDEIFEVVAAYAQDSPEEPYRFSLGEGLNGQVARNQEVMVLSRLPENYREVYSGLGRAQPSYLALVPLIYQKQCVALIECTGYRYQPDQIESMFRIMTRELAKILETGPEQPGP